MKLTQIQGQIDSLSMGGATDIMAAAGGSKWQISTGCTKKGDQGLMLTLTLDWLSEPHSDNFKLSHRKEFIISDGSYCTYFLFCPYCPSLLLIL